MSDIERPHERKASYIANYFHIPPQVFDSVELNRQLLNNVSDPRLQRWLNIEYLLRHAGVFALGVDSVQNSSASTVRLPQTPTMHRGVLLKLMQFSAPIQDEYGVCYTEISDKGTGVSSNDRKVYNGIAVNGDPIGFFGYEHSRQEQDLIY